MGAQNKEELQKTFGTDGAGTTKNSKYEKNLSHYIRRARAVGLSKDYFYLLVAEADRLHAFELQKREECIKSNMHTYLPIYLSDSGSGLNELTKDQKRHKAERDAYQRCSEPSREMVDIKQLQKNLGKKQVSDLLSNIAEYSLRG